jgi:hypothetical protein
MTRKTFVGLFIGLSVSVALAATVAAQTPQQTTQQRGAATTTTEKISGEVVKVDGNTLLVKMSTGELRTFSNIPDSRRAIVDGKEVGVRDLQPGTKLTATITKTMTPVTTRTVTVKTGTVWFVSGTTVILTHPDGKNKQYTVKDDYKFNVNGQPATVFDLRQGMTVAAEKIVEEPTMEITTDSRVVGTTPGAAPAAAAAAPKTAAPATSGSKPAATPTASSASAPAGAAPAKLPKTASPVPLMGLLGLLLTGGSLAMRKLRR